MKKMLCLMVLVLGFPAVGAGGDGNVCRPVDATAYETDFLIGEDVCDGWDYCIPSTVTGTFVGTMMEYFSIAYEMFDVFGTGDPVNTCNVSRPLFCPTAPPRPCLYNRKDISSSESRLWPSSKN